MLTQMADIFTKQERSRIMSLIRSKNTKPEIALCKLVSTKFYPLGYRYRRNYRRALGRPDIAFVSHKIAIFVDGEFWHGRNFRTVRKKLPKKYWLPKIRQNMERDRKVNRLLRKEGWLVLRFWERDVKKNPKLVVDRIITALER